MFNPVTVVAKIQKGADLKVTRSDIMENDRFVAACKRAFYSYTRGNDDGAQRLCRDYGISVCQVIDIALTNKGPKDDFLPPSELLHTSIRDLEKRGGILNDPLSLEGSDINWTAVTAVCGPKMTTRTTREWDGGNMGGNTNMRLVDLFPNPPQKLSDE